MMDCMVLLVAGCLVAALCLPASGAEASAYPVAFTITNPGRVARKEIARVSVPLPAGKLPAEPPQRAMVGGRATPVQAHAITWHPDGSARRVMLSIPVRLGPGRRLDGVYPAPSPPDPLYQAASGAANWPGEGVRGVRGLAETAGAAATIRTDAYVLRFEGESLSLVGPGGAAEANISAFGPQPGGSRPAALTVIENGPLFAWVRWRCDGSNYSREVDVQADHLGRVRLTQRILRHLPGNGWTPQFGFALTAPGAKPEHLPERPVRFLSLPVAEPMARHPELVASLRLAGGALVSLANPLSLRQHRGSLEAGPDASGVSVRFGRLDPVAQQMDELQMQEGAWQTVEVLLQPGAAAPLADAIDSPLEAHVDWRAYDAVYHTGPPLQVKSPALKRLSERYLVAIQSIPMHGDDWGSLGGLERYNHCQYIWEDYFRTGDRRLRRVALDYSENYNNYSVYWGPKPEFYGGGRYPANAETQPWPGSFHTRYNNAVTFCTKGYHSFWLAYEETGDPRFRTAAEAEARWSAEQVHATVNYMRCIGQVVDFVKMYEYTGDRFYLRNAERLWDEFQKCQNPDLLFNEAGVPSTGNDLYVPDDQFGYKHPYVKSYIVQYATNALSYLLAHRPEDRRLRETILACNDWMARVQTPGGGWSYPGPTTAGLGWSTEYAHGLMMGHEVEPRPHYLDAIQRELRILIALSEAYGAIPSGITPWEYLAGMTAADLEKRYHLATDRDRSRDFTDGRVSFGYSPDSTVYLQVLLRDYLRYRPEESLFTPDPVLAQILEMPAAVAGGYRQKGDAALRIVASARATPQGLRVRLRAEEAYLLAGKRPSFVWTLPDGTRRTGREATCVLSRMGTFEARLSARAGGREYSRSITLPAPAGPGDLGLRTWPKGTRIQAEAFAAPGGGELPVKVRAASEKLGSEGGCFSHWEAVNAWVEWRVALPRAGRCYLLAKYASPNASQRLVALDGRGVGTLVLAPTGGFSSATQDDWRVELLRDATGRPLALDLDAGAHVLRLTNTDAKGCNLDWLELVPAP